VPVERVKDYQTKLAEFLTTRKTDLLGKIVHEKKLSDELAASLKSAAEEFKQTWMAAHPPKPKS
jgi:F-type H+-transporting ATPase subunit alpha